MSESSGKHDRLNFLLNATEGGLWVAGASLLSPQTVLPALITQLGGGNIAIGAAGVILWVGLFLPQMFASRYGQTLRWKKPWVISFGTAQRCVVLASGIIILVLGPRHPHLALGVFLFLFAANQIILGLTTPVWFDLYAKLTPLQKRGRLMGVRNSIAGGLSLGSGFILSWILASYTFPHNYSYVFFLAFALQMAAIFFQSRLKEEFPSPTTPPQSMRAYLRHIVSVVRDNRPFRSFLTASSVLTVASMPLSFFAVYMLKGFLEGEEMVGPSTVIFVMGQVFGALLNGWLADWKGNRLALISAAAALPVADVLALSASSSTWFYAIFFFVGVNIGSELMARYNLAIEYGPVEHRATYIGLMNTLIAPFYLTGLLGGWISDTFGYTALFQTGIVASLVGIGFLIFRVQEPRRTKTNSHKMGNSAERMASEDD